MVCCAAGSCKAVTVLHDELCGAAVGPPPIHLHSLISAAEIAFVEILALSFNELAPSLRGRAKLRAGWFDVPSESPASN